MKIHVSEPAFSWRYGVLGLYRDRATHDGPMPVKIFHLYLPFVRVTITIMEKS